MTTYGTRTCLVCGKDFEADKAQRVCCSKECQEKRSRALKTEWDQKRKRSRETQTSRLKAENAALKAEIAELRAALEKAATQIQWNVCEKLGLRQLSKLPCGKRPACWSPEKCEHVPRGAKKEDAHEPAEEDRGSTAWLRPHKHVPKVPYDVYLPSTDKAAI